jgi:hypothetical protein
MYKQQLMAQSRLEQWWCDDKCSRCENGPGQRLILELQILQVSNNV